MGTGAPDASVRLLGDIARGDREAFARFYDLHAGLVHTLALRMLRERGEAEEVVQDVFLQAWRQAGTYSRDRGTPEAWLITMARSRGIDKLRSRRRRGEMVRPAEDPDRLTEPVAQAQLDETLDLAAILEQRALQTRELRGPGGTGLGACERRCCDGSADEHRGTHHRRTPR